MPKGRGSADRRRRKRDPGYAARQTAKRRRLRQQRQHSDEAAEEYRRLFRPDAVVKETLVVWAGDPTADPAAVAAGLAITQDVRDPDSGLIVPAAGQAPLTVQGLRYAAKLLKRYAQQHRQSFISDGEHLCSVRFDGDLTTGVGAFEFYLEGQVAGTVARIPSWVQALGHVIEAHAHEEPDANQLIVAG